MEHHLQKFNKSTKCDPKIITYFILDSKISSVLSAVLILAPYRKLISTTAVLEFLIRRWKADIGAQSALMFFFLKEHVYPYSRWRTLTFFYNGWKMMGSGFICCGKQVKIWLTFFSFFWEIKLGASQSFGGRSNFYFKLCTDSKRLLWNPLAGYPLGWKLLCNNG